MGPSTLVALPILFPLLCGALCIIARRSQRAQKSTALLGSLVLTLVSFLLLQQVWSQDYLVMEMGGWPAPFGIVLVADLLSAIMVVLTGVTGLATALFSLGTISKEHSRYGYYPLMFLLLAGVNGAFLTGDIFNLYVWFEVMLVASFSMLILGGERAQMEGAIKYVTLNLVSSAIFLAAIGLLYGLMGTLNMADLAQRIHDLNDTSLITVISMLFLVAFGIKAAAFPFFFWLPASYHTPQVAVSALFAGLLTKVGVYALFRMFTLVFSLEEPLTATVLIWVAGLTMLTGVLGAAAQFEFRRILSFHIISQIGYMLMGLALAAATPLALVGGIFYIMHHIIVKANLFLISGVVFALRGSYELKALGGLYRERPGLSLLFLISALSLAGIPPLSGFVAKYIVIRAGVEVQSWGLVAVALVVGLLTLYSMVKIWAAVFWKASPRSGTADLGDGVAHGVVPTDVNVRLLYTTVALLAGITVAIGLGAQAILHVAEAASSQLLNPSGYIDAVLGSGA